MEDLENGKRNWEEVIPRVKERMRMVIEKAVLAGQRMDGVYTLLSAEGNRFETLEIAQTIEQSIQGLQMELRRGGVKVRSEVPPSLTVSGSPLQLEIVFSNLMRNAIEAMQAIEKENRQIILSGSRDDGGVLIKVADTGPGIPGALEGQLFEAFFSTKAKSGRGIGLFLTQRIMENHRGTITIGRAPSGGAEFTIRLPWA